MGLVHLYKHECGLRESTNSSLLNCLSFFCMYFVVIFVVLFVLVNECSSERFMCELNTQGLMGLREKKFFMCERFLLYSRVTFVLIVVLSIYSNTCSLISERRLT